jgi:hypothetical protein
MVPSELFLGNVELRTYERVGELRVVIFCSLATCIYFPKKLNDSSRLNPHPAAPV